MQEKSSAFKVKEGEMMKDVRESSVGQNRGRTTIDDSRRMKFSKRAAGDNPTLEVIAKKCPKCGHHKAFRTAMKTACTRCRFTTWK